METGTTYEEKNITYWTKRAPSYAAIHQNQLASSQHDVWSQVLKSGIDSHFPARHAETVHVLDMGTGPGFFAILLAEMGYQVTAADYTESMLAQAKRNAGSLAQAISFQQMNAEDLRFASGSFDVIVSRNLTWNLPHPDKAYAEWVRVLKPGGVLMNFDANWYRYLYDDQARAGYEADRKQIKIKGVADETAGTDIAAMEAIAGQAPLSAVARPQWDRQVLTALGMYVHIDTHIWKTVWTEEQYINNASTPMFLVEAVKEWRS